ncbi:MAG: hypothetical protein HG453_005135 [Clostridiales bacterium]|nr:hypothetical protein [Clostridiales bacterium]
MNNRHRVDRLRAEQSISFDEFIELLVKLVEKALYEDQVKMSPDEGATINDRDKPINNPYIFFKIISGKTINSIKPRLMENTIRRAPGHPEYRPDNKYPVKENIEEEGVEVYRHAFEYVLQFDIFASSYATANKVLKDFEELMYDYTGYVKSRGVNELLYDQRLTDESNVQYREKYSVRSVRYILRIDKIFVVTRKLIERLLNLDK